MINRFKSGSNGRNKRLRKTRRNFWRADRPGKIDVRRAVGVLNNLIPRLAHSCKAVRVSTAHHHTLQFDQLPPHGGTLPVWCGWWHRNSFHHGHFFFLSFFFSVLLACLLWPEVDERLCAQCPLRGATVCGSRARATRRLQLAVPNNRLGGLSPSFALYAD